MPELLANELTREHARQILLLESQEVERLRDIMREARLAILGRLQQSQRERFTAQLHRVTLAQLEAGIWAATKRLQDEFEKTTEQAQVAAIKQILAEIQVWEPKFREGATGRIQLQALRNLANPRKLLLNRFRVSLETYGSQLIGEMQRRLAVHVAMRSRWGEMAEDIAGRLKKSAFQGSVWKAERIVRTELINALADGHQTALVTAAERIPGLRRQWDATNDARVCPICAALDGQVRGLREPFRAFGVEAFLPPAHPNCRCRVIPWKAAWAKSGTPDTSGIAEVPLAEPGTKGTLAVADRRARTSEALKAARAKQAVINASAARAQDLLSKLEDPDVGILAKAQVAREMLGLEELDAALRQLNVDVKAIRRQLQELREAAKAARFHAEKAVDMAMGSAALEQPKDKLIAMAQALTELSRGGELVDEWVEAAAELAQTKGFDRWATGAAIRRERSRVKAGLARMIAEVESELKDYIAKPVPFQDGVEQSLEARFTSLRKALDELEGMPSDQASVHVQALWDSVIADAKTAKQELVATLQDQESALIDEIRRSVDLDVLGSRRFAPTAMAAKMVKVAKIRRDLFLLAKTPASETELLEAGAKKAIQAVEEKFGAIAAKVSSSLEDIPPGTEVLRLETALDQLLAALKDAVADLPRTPQALKLVDAVAEAGKKAKAVHQKKLDFYIVRMRKIADSGKDGSGLTVDDLKWVEDPQATAATELPFFREAAESVWGTSQEPQELLDQFKALLAKKQAEASADGIAEKAKPLLESVRQLDDATKQPQIQAVEDKVQALFTLRQLSNDDDVLVAALRKAGLGGSADAQEELARQIVAAADAVSELGDHLGFEDGWQRAVSYLLVKIAQPDSNIVSGGLPGYTQLILNLAQLPDEMRSGLAKLLGPSAGTQLAKKNLIALAQSAQKELKEFSQVHLRKTLKGNTGAPFVSRGLAAMSELPDAELEDALAAIGVDVGDYVQELIGTVQSPSIFYPILGDSVLEAVVSPVVDALQKFQAGEPFDLNRILLGLRLSEALDPANLPGLEKLLGSFEISDLKLIIQTNQPGLRDLIQTAVDIGTLHDGLGFHHGRLIMLDKVADVFNGLSEIQGEGGAFALSPLIEEHTKLLKAIGNLTPNQFATVANLFQVTSSDLRDRLIRSLQKAARNYSKGVAADTMAGELVSDILKKALAKQETDLRKITLARLIAHQADELGDDAAPALKQLLEESGGIGALDDKIAAVTEHLIETNAKFITGAWDDFVQLGDLVSHPGATAKATVAAVQASEEAAEEIKQSPELSELFLVKQAEEWPTAQSGAPSEIVLWNGKKAKKIKGSSGSNPGGFYETEDGQVYFVKFPKKTGQVGAEVTSGYLAQRMGMHTKPYAAWLLPDGQHVGLASPKVGITELGPSGLLQWAKKDLADHFVHAIWVRNWDVVGLDYDNLVEVDGHLTVVDYGGSLLWRAQGELKKDGLPKVVQELKSLRDPSVNPQTSKVFSGLSDEQIAKSIIERLGPMTDEVIDQAVDLGHFSPSDAEKIRKGLRERRDWLLAWAKDKVGDVQVSGPPAAPKVKISKGNLSPEQVQTALFSDLPASADAALTWKPGATGKEGLAERYLKAVQGDVESMAKMGRRLWVGTPNVEANQDIALRFLLTAWQRDPNLVRQELGQFSDTMQPVLEALEEAGKGTADLQGIRKLIDAKALAIKQRELKAAEAARQKFLEAQKRRKERVEEYRKKLEEWEKQLRRKLKIPQKTHTAKGTWTKAMERAFAGAVVKIEEVRPDLVSELHDLSVELAQAHDRFELAPTLHARRAALQKILEVQARAMRLLEKKAAEAGILPEKPKPPIVQGLPKKKTFYRSQVRRSELVKAQRQAHAALGTERTHEYLQGTYDPERAWVSSPPPEPDPYDPDRALEHVVKFTGNHYKKYRAAKLGRWGYKLADGSIARTVSDDKIPFYKKGADDIDEWLARMPGFETSQRFPEVIRKEDLDSRWDRRVFLEQIAVPGNIVEWDSPSSASIDPTRWSGNLWWHITGQTSGVPVKGISAHPIEEEVLFPSGTALRVDRVVIKGKTVHVYCKEVFQDAE